MAIYKAIKEDILTKIHADQWHSAQLKDEIEICFFDFLVLHSKLYGDTHFLLSFGNKSIANFGSAF